MPGFGPKVKHRLIDLLIREVSAVDRAANLRQFLLLKSKGGAHMPKPKLDEVKALEAIEKIAEQGLDGVLLRLVEDDPKSLSTWLEKAEGIDDDQKQLVTAAVRVLGEELSTKIFKAFEPKKKDGDNDSPDLVALLKADGLTDEQLKRFVTSVAEVKEGKGDISVVLKDLPDSVRSYVEKAEKRAKEAEEKTTKLADRVDVMEVEKRRTQQIQRVAVLKSLPIKADDLGGDLLKVMETDKDVGDRIFKLLKAVNALLEDHEAFRRLSGESTGDALPGSAREEFEQVVEKAMKADKDLEYVDAANAAAKKDPDLYDRYMSEVDAGGKES